MLWNLNEFMLIFIILSKKNTFLHVALLQKKYKEHLNLYLKVYLQELHLFKIIMY